MGLRWPVKVGVGTKGPPPPGAQLPHEQGDKME